MDVNRKTAYLVLSDVESKKAYSNLAINHQVILNKPNSPAFVRELVYGVLEHKLTLDYYIDLLVKDGIESLKTPLSDFYGDLPYPFFYGLLIPAVQDSEL